MNLNDSTYCGMSRNHFSSDQQTYAEDKQKSFTIMKMKMYVILDKAKPHTENIKGLNLAAVNYTTVQVSRVLR
jgi:hypothetical protein